MTRTPQRPIPETLYRLAWLDERLATVGVCVIRDAKHLGVCEKTVRRDLELLGSLSELECVVERHGRKRWFYAVRTQRVFSFWFGLRAKG